MVKLVNDSRENVLKDTLNYAAIDHRKEIQRYLSDLSVSFFSIRRGGSRQPDQYFNFNRDICIISDHFIFIKAAISSEIYWLMS